MLRSMRCSLAPLVAVALVLLAPLAAEAQSAKDLKIGFVNVPKLLTESPQAVAASRSLENELGPRQRDLVAKIKAFKERSDKFQKDAAVMGADERRNAEAELRKDERELARQQDEWQEDKNRREKELLGKLQVDLLREVEAFARQNGYDVILKDALYVSPAIDVTEPILQALQRSSGQAPSAKAPAGKAPAKP